MPQDAFPKISIIMPVLNCDEMIEEAIVSVLNQDYPHTEFIIIDGGSTDQTVTIIKRYQAYLAYWHSHHDGSAALAVNQGLQRATGDLIALLMADDWYEPDTFKKISQAFKDYPSADLVSCGGRIVSYNKKTNRYQSLKTFSTATATRLTFYNICYGNPTICTRFIKKSFYEKVGGYLPFAKNGSQMLTNDKEFLLRVIICKANNVFINHVGYNYRAHKTSYSFGNHRSVSMRHCIEHKEIVNLLLNNGNLSFYQKIFLIYWEMDQTAHLVWHQLVETNIRVAYKLVRISILNHPFFWPLIFCYSTLSILLRRGIRLLKRLALI